MHIPLHEARFPDPGRRSRSRECTMRGCLNTTRENKPYCFDHLEEMPHAQTVLEALEDQANEHDAVKLYGYRAATKDSITTKEVLRTLRHHGERTLRRIAKDTGIDHSLIYAYVRAIRVWGYCKIDRNSRGNEVATITSAGIRHIDGTNK